MDRHLRKSRGPREAFSRSCYGFLSYSNDMMSGRERHLNEMIHSLPQETALVVNKQRKKGCRPRHASSETALSSVDTDLYLYQFPGPAAHVSCALASIMPSWRQNSIGNSS